MIQFSFVIILSFLLDLLTSPIGPPLVLSIGALLVWQIGKLTVNLDLTGTAAFVFWLIAVIQTVGLRIQPVVPIYSRPWQPFVLPGSTNLLWVGDGWNWYVSVLILLLGGVAILLSVFIPAHADETAAEIVHPITVTLTSNLAILATALLFVGSGNLLTVTLTWVVMDLLILARNALSPPSMETGEQNNSPAISLVVNQAQGFSLFGALLLLIGLLPAGTSGPSQPLLGGALPPETIALLLVAAAIRAGAYPFHLWLLPANRLRLSLPNRFLDQLVPGACGLWLLGWASGLGGKELLLQPIFVAFVLMALLASAVAAYTVSEKPGHTTFVLITSVSIAGLTSILSGARGPAALIWPTTTFALGGGLWLVGERIWREWGWQVPVSVGALALVGVPFTPGFLTQFAVARLLSGEFSGNLVMPFFIIYTLSQTVYVSAMLRSWGAPGQEVSGPPSPLVWRLLFSSVILAMPLVVAGIFPQFIAALTAISDTIPANVGNPPSAVADVPVWLTLVLPLLLGMGLALVRPIFWQWLGRWPDRFANLAGLEWFAQFTGWGGRHSASAWEAAIGVLEGRGAIGWSIAFVLISLYLLG
ncbi:MAG: hypothetical protein WAU10_17955 [Caldilineaceae bacterium]